MIHSLSWIFFLMHMLDFSLSGPYFDTHLDVWTWVNSLKTLCLSFLFCKMEMIIVLLLQEYYVDPGTFSLWDRIISSSSHGNAPLRFPFIGVTARSIADWHPPPAMSLHPLWYSHQATRPKGCFQPVTDCSAGRQACSSAWWYFSRIPLT